jgi:ankyrin repeat protein
MRFPQAVRSASVRGLLLATVAAGSGAAPQAQDGDLRLVEAVKAHHRDTVRALLAQHADVNVAQGDGATALHWAAYHDDLDTAALLLRAGANPGAANDYGVTPLSLACGNASAGMVHALLAAGADPTAPVASGETVLMTCARTGNVAAVTALLDYGADVTAREPVENQTALMWAAGNGHSAIVKVLLEYGADVKARSRVRRQVISRRLQSELKYAEAGRNIGTDAEETDVGGFTPLLFAARQGSVDSARLLLAEGAAINDTAPDGSSVLLVATHSGHGALARFLLERGANPNAAAAGYTALHAAVLTGDVEAVKALLARGARPNAQVTRATRVTRNGQVLMLGEHLLGATPFALAAKFTAVDIMRVLLAAGADAELPMKNGWTPLMAAAGASWRYGVWDRRDRVLPRDPATDVELHDERGTLEAVKLTLAAGAGVNAVDDDGNTALHHVVNKGFPGVVAFLAEHGATVAAKNNRGQTPLAILTARRRADDDEAGVSPATKATVDLLRRLSAPAGPGPRPSTP